MLTQRSGRGLLRDALLARLGGGMSFKTSGLTLGLAVRGRSDSSAAGTVIDKCGTGRFGVSGDKGGVGDCETTVSGGAGQLDMSVNPGGMGEGGTSPCSVVGVSG
jgi:hypothetical protein